MIRAGDNHRKWLGTVFPNLNEVRVEESSQIRKFIQRINAIHFPISNLPNRESEIGNLLSIKTRFPTFIFVAIAVTVAVPLTVAGAVPTVAALIFHIKRSLYMGSKSVVDLIEASSGVHFSGFHMNDLEQRHTEVEQPTTSATDNMHKPPFVIVVSAIS
ncbi:hypothetical protein FNV43_RR00137 [Rhamnella rubrinervis]|uniref:Uncharacterized protein n=1 Tax=Rhamnella rubrinervis TaxID=2594499 RepID=A0A8K0HMB9_9ROSA|nr:hypothetical protein FNV43_RR00137 [Rhamnella rubrinervis]